eukprot:TRINITY_DN4008_c2_g3_i1.p1 TRINITY_DN4008_c2_g3~~TRINITY_DN4008_c2_g3_i1.p1  ORF type:complete len:543 (+),score=159.06 TRINITY_DN4008_c2_g3_i1:117-1745(+)
MAMDTAAGGPDCGDPPGSPGAVAADRRRRAQQAPPQEFRRVRQLWRRMDQEFPKVEIRKPQDGEEPAPAADADPFLVALWGVWCGAHNSWLANGEKKVDEAASVVRKEHQESLGQRLELARELLRLAGWITDGPISKWCLAEPLSTQLLRAAAHFSEVKLGIGAPDATPDIGSHFGMMPMMVPDDFEQPPAPASPHVQFDVDELLKLVRDEHRLPDTDQMKTICFRAREMLLKEDNIVEVAAPATLVGDIHGQYWDLTRQVLAKGGDPATTRYVFLGDFVDRGEHSLLSLALILLLKLRYPSNISLLRGNHESRITNNMYGFHEECRHNYPAALSGQSSLGCSPDNEIWVTFNHLFDSMPLAALVGDRIFCCHGGLSPQLPTLDRLLTFDRVHDIVPPGSMADLTWSDPGCASGWRMNARGSGFLFGEDISKRFCSDNHLLYVCRAHQCVREGYKWEHDGHVLTVFSAPNYCWQANKGAILRLGEDLAEDIYVYEDAKRPEVQQTQAAPNHYFAGQAESEEIQEEIEGFEGAAEGDEEESGR